MVAASIGDVTERSAGMGVKVIYTDTVRKNPASLEKPAPLVVTKR
jgi:hypothetical protein